MTPSPSPRGRRRRLRLFAPYLTLLAAPGTRPLVLAGVLGRFPLSMLGLGTVLLVSSVSGSYGLAGAVSATISVAGSAAAPFAGVLADRFGQRPLLLAGPVVHVAGGALLVAAAVTDAPSWTLFPAAVVAGIAMPEIGPLVRTRWTHLVGGTPRLHTALSLESVLDEVVFVLGPPVATVLATAVWSPAAVVAALALALTGALWLAAQRGTAPPPGRAGHERRVSAMRSNGMRLLVAVFVALGMTFGCYDVAMVGFAQDHGSRLVAGPLLAGLAFASLVAGLVYGAVSWTAPLRRRFVVALACLAAGTVPMALATSVPVMAVAVVINGLAIAPSLVGGFGLVGTVVPPSARTEGFAWFSAAIGIGFAAGASVTGRIVDAAGGHRAFLVAVVASAATVAVAAGGYRALRPRAELRVVADVPAA